MFFRRYIPMEYDQKNERIDPRKNIISKFRNLKKMTREGKVRINNRIGEEIHIHLPFHPFAFVDKNSNSFETKIFIFIEKNFQLFHLLETKIWIPFEMDTMNIKKF